MRKWLIPTSLVMVGSVVMIGCGDSDSDSTAATTEGATTAPDAGNVFEVSFDGDVCTAPDRPSELPEGSYTFVLTDTSGRSPELYFRTLVDGVTFEEADAVHEAAGGDGSCYPKPDWAVPVAPDVQAEKLTGLADNQTQYDPMLPPGLNGLAVGTDSPDGVWQCWGFVVTPASN